MCCVRWWQRTPFLIRCFTCIHCGLCAPLSPGIIFFPLCVLPMYSSFSSHSRPSLSPFHCLSPPSRLFFTLRTPSLFFLFLSLIHSHTLHSFLFSSSLSHSHSPSTTTLIQPTLTLSSLHHTPTLTRHPLLIAHTLITLNNH